MFRMVTLAACALACVAAQNNVDPKLAKILKEQRFNAGDGRTGAAFATEDGVIFREESDNAGNRIGQYSYIGDNGQTYTVKYSAGKDGFRILDGSHVPAGGQDAAAFDPNFGAEEEQEPLPAEPQQPVLNTRPLPPPPAQRPAPVQQQFAQRPAPVQQQFVPQPQAQEINPFINPNDPTHLDFQFNKHALNFAPDSPLSKQQSLVPKCADCEGFNPFFNPHDPTHRSGVLAGHLAGHQAGAQPAPRPQPAPRSQPAPRPQPQPAPLSSRLRELEEPRPKNNFFPPGKLQLNRFESGFNFDFES